MMCRENCGEPKPLGGEHREHGAGVARVDDGDGARIGATADHPDVVVLEGRDRPNVEHARVYRPRRRGGGYAFPMASHAIDLDAWFAGPLGSMLIEQERAVVADSLECAFGLHCLQVGAWGAVDTFLSRARTRRTALVASRPRPAPRSSPNLPPSRCSPTAWT